MLRQNDPNPDSQSSISARLTAARATDTLAVAGQLSEQDAGRSLAEMAQRDLDAALQLLADRAQFITGASGAAIALRRDGKNDMLCRASAGSNAPELGTLLSTEFGLSGESVRTRQLLRCDDAERDARVNREVCRQMGIASVVVMPVVNDDEVLGVFELFSGKANAFGDRDVSAVQRLSGMVETAVRLAYLTQNLPAQLKAASNSSMEAVSGSKEEKAPKVEEEILDVQILDVSIAAVKGEANVSQAEELVLPAIDATTGIATEHAAKDLRPEVAEASPVKAAVPATPTIAAVAQPAVEAPAPQKPLFWSAANLDPSAEKPEDSDQSHVPPVLRGLRKCEACGFPISEGRALCVECEEKKWRGQLKRPMPTGAIAPIRSPQAFAAAAQSLASASPASITPEAVIAQPALGTTPKLDRAESATATATGMSPAGMREAERDSVAVTSPAELILSAGLEPSQTWFAANKYVIGALLLVAILITAVVLFR